MMTLAHSLKSVRILIAALALALFAAVAAPGAIAQDGSGDTAIESASAGAQAETASAKDDGAQYVPLGPDMIKGQPVPAGIDVQEQYSENGEIAHSLHRGLVWVMVAISGFVLALLLWVVVRFNKRANPTPSKTTHNTALEVVWTLVPVLILVGIAVPSISLIARQYDSPPEDAITVKAIGVQWYWEYEYPDHGVSILSKMLNVPGKPEVNAGVRELGSEPWDGPAQLEVDNRLVVPVGVPLRIQTIANDVIHSFAVPSLWFKLDAVPGRLNERMLTIKEPGIYYGQCSELCGVKHAYMPIAIEAVPMDKWKAWIRAKGGNFPEDSPSEQSAEPDAVESGADTPAAAAPGEVPVT